MVGAVRSAAGEWSTPVVISDPSAYTSVGDAGTLRVTSDARGNSIVAWLNEYDGRGYAADLPAGATSWLPQQRTAVDNGRGTSRAGGRNIALMMNNRGDAAVAWGAGIAGPMSIATRETRRLLGRASQSAHRRPLLCGPLRSWFRRTAP